MYSIGWVGHAGGVLDRDHALIGRLVGERRAGHEVADRVDALGARAHRAVDLDQAALAELHARGVEPERLDVGAAPGGDHEPVGLARLIPIGELHPRSLVAPSPPACWCGS